MERREFGAANARHTVLLLPGGLCNAVFFDDLVRDPALHGIRFVAVTLPGFCGTDPLPDPTVEAYSAATGALAAELDADAIVGHSYGGNVALELVAAGGFAGRVLLLEPAFSRHDEYAEIRVLDRLARVPGLGGALWAFTIRTLGLSMRGELPKDRHAALVAEMRKNDPAVCRRIIARYMEYLDRHGELVPRLTGSGARATVVKCDRSKVGLTDAERAALDASTAVTLVDVADSGHFVMLDQPARTAELIRDLVSG